MADFGLAQPSVALHSIQFMCMKLVEFSVVFPLIDRSENVDPCLGERHRGEDRSYGGHAVSSVGRDANLIAMLLPSLSFVVDSKCVCEL
jgi:hypothetical protein